MKFYHNLLTLLTKFFIINIIIQIIETHFISKSQNLRKTNEE